MLYSDKIDNNVIEKALAKLDKSQRKRRILKKQSEDFQVFQEVFDKATLMTLYRILNSQIISYLNGVVRAGKESNVFWGVTPEGNNVAVKIFLTVASDFKKKLLYIEGDYRFRHIQKNNYKLIALWTKKEFKNLHLAYSSEIPVPKPLYVRRNVLIMEFIGGDGIPAPTLAEVEVDDKDLDQVLLIIKKLYQKAHLVHSDLSEFNLFKHSSKIIAFDFASAVNISHPMSDDFLLRDLNNINRFFVKRGYSSFNIKEMYKDIVGE